MLALVLELSARTRVALGWWLLGILSMAAYVVGAYETLGSLQNLSQLYKDYPPAIRELFGEVDISTIEGWIQVELFSYLPLLLGIYGGIYAAGSISREAEQRIIDFTLGLPISRVQFIASRLIVGMMNLFVICLAVFVVLVVGLAVIGRTPAADRFALALLNAYLLGAALLAFYVAFASVIDEQGRVTGIALGITLVLYIASGAFKAADMPDGIRWLTPFEHYHAAQAMSGDGLPVLPLVVLLVAAVIAGSAALYWYNRRDLAT